MKEWLDDLIQKHEPFGALPYLRQYDIGSVFFITCQNVETGGKYTYATTTSCQSNDNTNQKELLWRR
jgi:hypothetical protein